MQEIFVFLFQSFVVCICQIIIWTLIADKRLVLITIAVLKTFGWHAPGKDLTCKFQNLSTHIETKVPLLLSYAFVQFIMPHPEGSFLSIAVSTSWKLDIYSLKSWRGEETKKAYLSAAAYFFPQIPYIYPTLNKHPPEHFPFANVLERSELCIQDPILHFTEQSRHVSHFSSRKADWTWHIWCKKSGNFQDLGSCFFGTQCTLECWCSCALSVLTGREGFCLSQHGQQKQPQTDFACYLVWKNYTSSTMRWLLISSTSTAVY